MSLVVVKNNNRGGPRSSLPTPTFLNQYYFTKAKNSKLKNSRA